MQNDNRVVTLTDFEHRLLVGTLNEFRNELISDGRPTEDINKLMLKILDAPTKVRRLDCER